MDRFEKGHMERGRDTVVSRKLQLVRYLINTSENLERAYVPRAELPAGQTQLDVPLREPDPLSRFVGRVRTSASVGLDLLIPYSPLKTHMSTVPHPLTTFNPVVNCRNRGRFTRPREHRGLIPQDTLEGGEACRCMSE